MDLNDRTIYTIENPDGTWSADAEILSRALFTERFATEDAAREAGERAVAHEIALGERRWINWECGATEWRPRAILAAIGAFRTLRAARLATVTDTPEGYEQLEQFEFWVGRFWEALEFAQMNRYPEAQVGSIESLVGIIEAASPYTTAVEDEMTTRWATAQHRANIDAAHIYGLIPLDAEQGWPPQTTRRRATLEAAGVIEPQYGAAE